MPDQVTPAEVKAAIEDLGNLTKSAIRDLEKRQTEFELRMGRQRLAGAFGDSGSQTEERKQLNAALRHLAMTGDDRELKTLYVGSDPDGGFGVVPHLSSEMV